MSNSTHDKIPSSDDHAPRLKGYLLLRGLILPLQKAHGVVLGRDREACDIILSDERVSKQHAVISKQHGRYVIRDLGSVNGIYVNDQRIEDPSVILPGDQIKIQPFNMLFIGQDATGIGTEEKEVKAEPQALQGDLSGKLTLIPIADLIQMLNSANKSGELIVTDLMNIRGELTFKKGEIIKATYGRHEGEPAVFAILGTTDGRFVFTQGTPPVPDDPIQRKTVSLLLEGHKELDESNARKKTQPIDVATSAV